MMAYHDKYKKILNEIRKDKRELDEKTVKEDEDAVKRIQGEALKEKDDPGAFIFPISILKGNLNGKCICADTVSELTLLPAINRNYEQLGRDDFKNEDRGDHDEIRLCIHRYCWPRVLWSDYMRNVESDSVDEEEYMIKRNKFGAPIYGPRPAPYLNCANPEDRSSAIQAELTIRGRGDQHDPKAQDMKQWKRCCFHKFTTSFCYGKDAPEMLSLGWDCIKPLSLMKMDLMFTLNEESHFYYQESNLEGDSQDDHLWYANVAWLIAKWMTKKGVGIQKDSKGLVVLSVFAVDSLSLSLLGNDAIDQMEYKESYHWDIYHGVFEHMAGVYSVPLKFLKVNHHLHHFLGKEGSEPLEIRIASVTIVNYYIVLERHFKNWNLYSWNLKVKEELNTMLIGHKLGYKRVYIANRNWNIVDVIKYGEIKEAITLKLKFREQMRRLLVVVYMIS
ncbi:hypothetical protein Tco_1007997 [Tanacetum coccineum]